MKMERNSNQLISDISSFLESKKFSDIRVAKHAENPILLKRKLDSFKIYNQLLKKHSAEILDWGCGAGLTSLIIKYYLRDKSIKIHGCDIHELNDELLVSETGMIYSKLDHHYKMPYENETFDYVIANGVLEHVANDHESLKEIYRILKINGYLIITFLPNILSLTEVVNQFLNNFLSISRHYHRRRYSVKEIKYILLHSGFLTVSSGYHQVIPSLSSLQRSSKRMYNFLLPVVSFLYGANIILERLWPVNRISSNIFVISQKKKSIP